MDFTDYFWLLTTGDRPNAAQKTILNACLVAIAEHGLVPSVQAARMTLAAAPEAWQGAMAAGLLGMGSVVAGSSEIAGNYLEELIAEADGSNDDLKAVVVASLKDLRTRRQKVPRLGHPQHNTGDPRANKLMQIADEAGVSSRRVETLRLLGRHAPKIMERPLPINVSGAIPAVILDAGWPPAAIKGTPLLARAGAEVFTVPEIVVPHANAKVENGAFTDEPTLEFALASLAAFIDRIARDKVAASRL